MATTLVEIKDVYNETIATITSDSRKWQSFLNCASRNYKYDFDDCALTEKDKLQKLKQDLINAVIAQNTTLDFDESENYDNCRKNVR